MSAHIDAVLNFDEFAHPVQSSGAGDALNQHPGKSDLARGGVQRRGTGELVGRKTHHGDACSARTACFAELNPDPVSVEGRVLQRQRVCIGIGNDGRRGIFDLGVALGVHPCVLLHVDPRPQAVAAEKPGIGDCQERLCRSPVADGDLYAGGELHPAVVELEVRGDRKVALHEHGFVGQHGTPSLCKNVSVGLPAGYAQNDGSGLDLLILKFLAERLRVLRRSLGQGFDGTFREGLREHGVCKHLACDECGQAEEPENEMLSHKSDWLKM